MVNHRTQTKFQKFISDRNTSFKDENTKRFVMVDSNNMHLGLKIPLTQYEFSTPNID